MIKHNGFGYKGHGVYACLCGHALNSDNSSSEAILYCSKAQVDDLKIAHLAHRLEAEPEALGRTW